MEAWKKSGLCIWKCSHTPASLIFLMIPLFSQTRATVGTLTSIPWEQLSASSTVLREPHRTPGMGASPGLTQHRCSPPPMKLWARVSFSRAYCYYKRVFGPPKCAKCLSKRKIHIFLTSELRQTDIKLHRDGQWLCGDGQRRKVRQLWEFNIKGVGIAEATTIQNSQKLSRIESVLKMI